jgi:hypothetical protein
LDVAVNRKKNKGHLSGSIPGLQVAPEVVAASGLRDVVKLWMTSFQTEAVKRLRGRLERLSSGTGGTDFANQRCRVAVKEWRKIGQL